MFSALQQNSLVYILDKTDGTKFKVGKVESISAPQTNYNLGTSYINIKVNVDGNIHEYNQIPSNLESVSYNNNRVTLSETKQGLLSEVETILQNSRLIVDNIDTYKQNIVECENILKLLNPLFAKDKERDERLTALEDKFSGVESKIDKLITLIEK